MLYNEYLRSKGLTEEGYINLSPEERDKIDEDWNKDTEEDEIEEIDPDDYSDKHNALAKYLGVSQTNIEECKWVKGEYFEYGREEYRVLTDSEADDAWDESLDNYIEECIYPEIPKWLYNYFDEEAWRRDAKYDGRGHSLSTYDGEENEIQYAGEWFYIYRTN